MHIYNPTILRVSVDFICTNQHWDDHDQQWKSALSFLLKIWITFVDLLKQARSDTCAPECKVVLYSHGAAVSISYHKLSINHLFKDPQLNTKRYTSRNRSIAKCYLVQNAQKYSDWLAHIHMYLQKLINLKKI